VYAPHDLSSVEMGKWKGKFGAGGKGMGMGKGIGGGRGREWGDVCDVLGVEPVGEYKVRLSFTFAGVSGQTEGNWDGDGMLIPWGVVSV